MEAASAAGHAIPGSIDAIPVRRALGQVEVIAEDDIESFARRQALEEWRRLADVVIWIPDANSVSTTPPGMIEVSDVKGLEYEKVLIVADPNCRADDPVVLRNLYVALTRGASMVTLIATSAIASRLASDIA